MKKINGLTLILCVIFGALQFFNSPSFAADDGKQKLAIEWRAQANLIRIQTLSDYYGYEPAQPVLPAVEISPNPPEPGVMVLLGLGMMGLVFFRRRFKG